MGRGGKVSSKRNLRRRVRPRDKGSDDSDEDYIAEEDEEVEVSDGSEYCSDSPEESFNSFEEEEDGEEEEVRKVVRSKARKGCLGQKKIGVKRSRKRKRVLCEEEEEDYDYEDEDDDDDDDDDEDEEFTPDKIDSAYDEEEMSVRDMNKNRKKVSKQAVKNQGNSKGRKRKRNSRVLKKPLEKKGRRNGGLGRKASRNNGGEFLEKIPAVRAKGTKNLGQRRRKLVAQSESDFVSSGSSDYEFTISEEEREQMREAGEFCRSYPTGLRSSSSSNRIQNDHPVRQRRKAPVKKGKEKVVDPKNELGKQVCGICFSEEGKNMLRGTLNCCSHYFCFPCIMEWSKVESRCPLCKRRFATISKPARLNTGIDLRNVVIQIPERDQVYQPTEEEMRGYLDPYEHVICTECQQGGDDGLMLLCDLCDSPAHTYCVGLGREVPEGNWYCEGCRPVALGSSNFQTQDPSPDQRVASNNLSTRLTSVETIREGLDLHSSPSPRPTLAQGTGTLNSPTYPVGDVQTTPLAPGAGAGPSTLSGRRWIQRQIHNFLSSNRMGHMAGRTDGISGFSAANSASGLLNSQIHHAREPAFQQTPEIGTSRHTFIEERLPNNSSPSLQNRDLFSPRLSLLRRHVAPDLTTTATDGSVRGMPWADFMRANMISSSQQPHQHSGRPNIGSDSSLSPCMAREGSRFYMAKEQLQSMVKSHLKSLSRDVELGNL
ncbi:uncharacterized protein LOC131154102 isoform X2 [Malania oleifera]|uniref:uncharacterized protein LOC131154102 isoform X2 n=1 Tax=Malania oleifera TaxID=397392 RepID=UPI0025ADBE30|nr:uncharacterized protein LOC131154102 isoform X2 [Malania oleifera]XP_057962602.1 uncharacterized protein LOC131154102 isoform X2 [Malania oleifera]